MCTCIIYSIAAPGQQLPYQEGGGAGRSLHSGPPHPPCSPGANTLGLQQPGLDPAEMVGQVGRGVWHPNMSQAERRIWAQDALEALGIDPATGLPFTTAAPPSSRPLPVTRQAPDLSLQQDDAPPAPSGGGGSIPVPQDW